MSKKYILNRDKNLLTKEHYSLEIMYIRRKYSHPDLANSSNRPFTTASQLITLGLAGHPGLADCKPPIGPRPNLHHTKREVFVDPFPQDLESLFLEEDAASAEFAIKDTKALEISRQLVVLAMTEVSSRGFGFSRRFTSG